MATFFLRFILAFFLIKGLTSDDISLCRDVTLHSTRPLLATSRTRFCSSRLDLPSINLPPSWPSLYLRIVNVFLSVFISLKTIHTRLMFNDVAVSVCSSLGRCPLVSLLLYN